MKKVLIAIPVIILAVVAVLVIKRINEKKANLEHVELGINHLHKITAVLEKIKDDASFNDTFPELEAAHQAHDEALDYGPKRRVVSADESLKFFAMFEEASEPLKKEAERIIYAEGISIENKKKFVTELSGILPVEPEIGGKTWMETCLENFEKGIPPFQQD